MTIQNALGVLCDYALYKSTHLITPPIYLIHVTSGTL